jgi:hypothetical protein
MAMLRQQLISSQELSTVGDFYPTNGSYLFQLSGEQRSEHVEGLMRRASGVQFVRFEGNDDDCVTVAGGGTISFRRAREVRDFLTKLGPGTIYVDITGMSHEVWAPLARGGLELGLPMKVVYVEPQAYARSVAPRRGDVFDLSERIQGVAPLPSFATITDEGEGCFVAFLGFEGARFSLMLNEMEPPQDLVYPVVGVPGFRPEYPFHSLLGNSVPLSRSRSFHRMRYARSNCPFSAYFALDEISSRHPAGTMQVALTGTKPHALGAVIYAVQHPRRVELLYDYVIRKPARTSGSEQCFIYDLAEFKATLSAA